MKKLLIIALLLAGCQKEKQHIYGLTDRVRPIDCGCLVQKPAYIDSVIYRGPDASEYHIHDMFGHGQSIWSTDLLAY